MLFYEKNRQFLVFCHCIQSLFIDPFSLPHLGTWYLDRFDTFGYAWGMRHPIALAHGTNGRTFVVGMIRIAFVPGRKSNNHKSQGYE